MRLEITKTPRGYRLSIDYDGAPTQHEQELIRGVTAWVYEADDLRNPAEDNKKPRQ